MHPWGAGVWGLAGGLCVEALALYATIRGTRRWNWRRPIPQGLMAYLISVVVRVGSGAFLAAAAAGSGQVSGSLAAFGLGAAAPLVVEKLSKTVPLTGSVVSSEPTPEPVGTLIGRKELTQPSANKHSQRETIDQSGSETRADR